MVGRMEISNKYYLTTNKKSSFVIKIWDKDKVIAIDNQGSLCLSRILYMDINTQEVFIKSFVNSKYIESKYCTTFKGQSMPIILKLVDYHESPWEYYIKLIVKSKSTK